MSCGLYTKERPASTNLTVSALTGARNAELYETRLYGKFTGNSIADKVISPDRWVNIDWQNNRKRGLMIIEKRERQVW